MLALNANRQRGAHLELYFSSPNDSQANRVFMIDLNEKHTVTTPR